MRGLPLKILHLYFLLTLLTFAGVQTLKYFSIHAPDWVFFYLNDFLTIPIVATFCLHAVWFIKRDRSLRLSFSTIFSLVVMYSVYFEIYLPTVSERYTGDILDIICYFAGGLIFYFLQSFPLKKSVPSLGASGR